jgi:chemotaxis protein CheC
MSQATAYHIDTLKEFINIGVGRAANALNEMVGFRVNLQVPFIKVLNPQSLQDEMEELGSHRVAAVKLGFEGRFSGTAALVFPPDSASRLVSVLTGEAPDTPDLDSVRAGTLSEVGNIVINSVMGSLGNLLKERIHYSLPHYAEDTVAALLQSEKMDDNAVVLLVRTHFAIEHLRVEGYIILLFTFGSFDIILSAIDGLK